MKFSAPMASVILLLFAFVAGAQDLPDKIRGYKVHRAKVRVATASAATTPNANGLEEAVVKVGEPRIVDVALAGVTFEADADLGGIPQSGRVDFLTFRDFRVNGVAIEFDEYNHSFDVKKGVAMRLPKPVRGRVGSLNIAKAAYKETVESKSTWQVTGTVFVFGKFKKFGFKFKRVVPVQIELKVKNPLT
ncbi:MAG: hypothetical protein ACKVQW_02180 [Pyrinomonadaceae bacterium]